MPPPPPPASPDDAEVRVVARALAFLWKHKSTLGLLVTMTGGGYRTWTSNRDMIAALRHDFDVSEATRKADHDLLVAMQADIRALRGLVKSYGLDEMPEASAGGSGPHP